MSKKTEHTYENFLACFAGVYRKHTKARGGSNHTCYVRAAIVRYCADYRTEEGRKGLLEDASGTELIGYRIASALRSQGWSYDTIREFSDLNQATVDEIEDENGDMCGDMWERICRGEVEGYTSDWQGEWSSHWNYARWVWLRVGAPNTRATRCVEDFLAKRGESVVSDVVACVAPVTTVELPTWAYLRSLSVNDLFGLLANPDVTD